MEVVILLVEDNLDKLVVLVEEALDLMDLLVLVTHHLYLHLKVILEVLEVVSLLEAEAVVLPVVEVSLEEEAVAQHILLVVLLLNQKEEMEGQAEQDLFQVKEEILEMVGMDLEEIMQLQEAEEVA